MHLVDPLAGKIGESSEVPGSLSRFVSNLPIWLGEAADPVIRAL
jgi:hypothetical protein